MADQFTNASDTSGKDLKKVSTSKTKDLVKDYSNPGSGKIEDVPLTDTANKNPDGNISVSEPKETGADPNSTTNITKVETPGNGTNARTAPLTDEQVRVAALGASGLVTSATTEAPEAPVTINAADGPKEKADRDAMIERRIALIRRAFGATNFHLGDTQGDAQVYILTDVEGKEVATGTLDELNDKALDSLPDADEPAQDLQVPNVATHAINNLDDLKNGLGALGATTNIEKIGDHYAIEVSHTGTVDGKVTTYSGQVTVNAKKDELTKFFRKAIAALGKKVKALEDLLGSN